MNSGDGVGSEEYLEGRRRDILVGLMLPIFFLFSFFFNYLFLGGFGEVCFSWYSEGSVAPAGVAVADLDLSIELY